MSVCSVRWIVSDSLSASGESNRQSSTRVACSEKSAKLTPTPSHVAPRGYGEPGQTRIARFATEAFSSGIGESGESGNLAIGESGNRGIGESGNLGIGESRNRGIGIK